MFSQWSDDLDIAYHFQNKQRSLTLGSYPDVSLADARIKATEARKT